MALDSLSAANGGTPTPLAGKNLAAGFAGAVVPVDGSGNEIVPATETTLAALETLLTSLLGTKYNHNDPFSDGSAGLLILGKRRDSDSTVVADGDLNTFNMDEEGRLKVASKPASYPDITGDITAVQATIGTPVAGGTVAGDVSRASNLMIFCTGTFAGVNCTFEGSLEATGDTNWFAVQCVRSNANTIELTTGALSAQPAYAWEASVNALKRFRVRATARTSGTQSWRFVQGTYATEPIPASQVSGTQPVSGTVAVSSAALTVPTIVADVASAALTTTTTTAAIAPSAGTSYEVVIPVTAVSGTTPTLDVGIEESDDTGTNWFRVYDFPRITATGIYRSPKLPLTGNRIRYVQTVSGTSPSFTRAVNRLQSNESVASVRQIIDRALASSQALNSTTGSLNVQNCRAAQLLITAGAITTTAPAIQLEGSDDNGTTWYAIGSPLTAVASSTVRAIVVDTNSQLIRGRVSTAGSGATITHVLLKGF